MRTKWRLNWGFAMGSLVLAILVGVVTQSLAAFWIALVLVLVSNVVNREIRP